MSTGNILLIIAIISLTILVILITRFWPIKFNDDFLNLFLKVKGYRVNLETCYSAKEGMIVSNLLKELIAKNTYKNDYNSRTFPLLYDGTSYENCISSLERIIDFLKSHNL